MDRYIDFGSSTCTMMQSDRSKVLDWAKFMLRIFIIVFLAVPGGVLLLWIGILCIRCCIRKRHQKRKLLEMELECKEKEH